MPRPSPWLMTPALVACTWLLSAQSPPSSTQLADLEKRVAELEARVAKAGNVTQVKAPFVVLGTDGRPILEVLASPNNKSTGAVLIARHPGTGGGVYVMDEAGKAQAGMGIAAEGHGAVYTFNKAGKVAAQMSGTPSFALWNDQGDNVAVMNVTKEGKGRFSIWANNARLVLLEDSAGAGSLSLMKGASGQAVARLGVGLGGGGRLAVMSADGNIGAAVIGEVNGGGVVGVARNSGQTVAEMGVSPEGVGMVQITSPTGQRAAVMSQGGDGGGGIFQVFNGAVLKATIGTAEGGGGMMQLSSANGSPTVEAGTLRNGKGIVRVGPFWKCSPIQPATPVMSVGHVDCLVGSTEAK